MKEIFTQGETPAEQQLVQLAEVYKEAFARPPWNEVSQCTNEECEVNYSEQSVDNCCQGCGGPLKEAYNTQELMAAWIGILKDQNGFMELESLDDMTPLRVTIARPTTPNELYERKYAGNNEMKEWLQLYMPEVFVWIEDTFANLKVRPQGNLKNREETLQNIASAYNNLPIYTRTITPEIVAATLRAATDATVYVGSRDTQKMTQLLTERGGTLGDIKLPDFRTIIAINSLRNSVKKSLNLLQLEEV